MKNFEKYEKEIKEAIHDLDFSDVVSELAGYHLTGAAKIVEWLYSEYREPLLTDEEREYLKAVIKPLQVKISFIEKCGGVLLIDYGANIDIEIPTKYIFDFKGLTPNTHYSLEELGL